MSKNKFKNNRNSAVVRISTAVHAHAHALDPLDDRRLLPPPQTPLPPPDTTLPISPPTPTRAHRADNNNNDDAAAVRHVQAAPAPVCREGSRAVFTSARGRHVSEIFSSTHAHAQAHTHTHTLLSPPPPPHRRRRRRFSVVTFRIAGAHDHRRAADIVVRRSPFAVDGSVVDRDENKSIMGGMDTDQLYSVRWNEFHTSIITSFRHLLDQEDFIDVTIACDGHSFTAHKVVLSACSPYFRSLLKANPCQHPIVILRDVKKQEMEALLSFMYNGEVRINQEHLPEFLKTARSLQVRGLVDFTKENQPSSWGSSSVVPVDVVGKTKASDNLPSPPYKRQRNNSEQLTTQPLTPSSSYNADRDKDTPSLLVQALELNQSQSSQNKNAVDSSVTGHSSDEEDSNSGDSDGSHTVNDNTRSDVNQQNNDIVIQPQISQAQHSKLEPVDFLSSSGNNHDLHNTSISIEQQSRHSFPTSISSGVSIISSLQGLPGLLPGPSGIHNNSQENSYARRSIEMTRVRATDPRPCPKCGKIYRSAHTLRTHLEDKHTVCSGYRCVLCGTVAKSRNSLHSHMSRQHRGISTKDLPVQPMPSNFDPELASNLLLKAGVKVSPAELRARASPTDAVTTSHRRGDGKLDLQSANSSVCGGDDPEDLTVNSSGHHHHGHHHNNNNHHHQQYGNNNNNNNQQRFSDSQQQQLLQQQQQLLHNSGGGKFPTAMDLIDNYARVGGGGGGGSGGGALSPFLPSFAACGKDLQPGDSKISPYNNKAFLDSYLKALVETNPPLFYASKIAGDMIKHEIAPDDADYSSASDEDDIDEDDIDEDVDEDIGDEDDDDHRRRRGHNDGGAAGSVNDTPLPLQAGKN